MRNLQIGVIIMENNNTNHSLILSEFIITNFRNFHDIKFSLGKRLTVISGQNGVGKSNLLSLIASGSGISKKSGLRNNFQPQFYEFFHINSDELTDQYKLYLTYKDRFNPGLPALTKRLSFKNDTKSNRYIRVIPRTSKFGEENLSTKNAKIESKKFYGVGPDARIHIPTIYLSLSRLYPLGEDKEVTVSSIGKTNHLYIENANKKFKDWYNYIIPNSIKDENTLSKINKKTNSQSSYYLKLEHTHALSQSVGQDNVGNIVSALVDIYLLSKSDDYSGALLCIDEVDVSLHPDTVIRLLDLLDNLSNKLEIQVVLTSHSLTVLKYLLDKSAKDSINYKVVYLKNPSLPTVTEQNNYELLKADLFGRLSYKTPKVKIYFEDKTAVKLFNILFDSYQELHNKFKLESQKYFTSFNSNFKAQIEKFLLQDYDSIMKIKSNTSTNALDLGCEELIKLAEADNYFDRIILMLDGDARLPPQPNRPTIHDYINRKFTNKGLSDRKHKPNICFLPGYLPPESFLFYILHTLCFDDLKHITFWRNLDAYTETSLFTSDKFKAMMNLLPSDFTNDDLKKNEWDIIWDFFKKSNALVYYYLLDTNIIELRDFFKKLIDAYNMAYPKMLENKY